MEISKKKTKKTSYISFSIIPPSGVRSFNTIVQRTNNLTYSLKCFWFPQILPNYACIKKLHTKTIKTCDSVPVTNLFHHESQKWNQYQRPWVKCCHSTAGAFLVSQNILVLFLHTKNAGCFMFHVCCRSTTLP